MTKHLRGNSAFSTNPNPCQNGEHSILEKHLANRMGGFILGICISHKSIR